jgi:hypothetical protein
VLLLLLFCYCLMLTLLVCEVFCGIISSHWFSALLHLSESDKHGHVTFTSPRSVKDVHLDTYLICPFALFLIVPVPCGWAWLVSYFNPVPANVENMMSSE